MLKLSLAGCLGLSPVYRSLINSDQAELARAAWSNTKTVYPYERSPISVLTQFNVD